MKFSKFVIISSKKNDELNSFEDLQKIIKFFEEKYFHLTIHQAVSLVFYRKDNKIDYVLFTLLHGILFRTEYHFFEFKEDVEFGENFYYEKPNYTSYDEMLKYLNFYKHDLNSFYCIEVPYKELNKINNKNK